MIRRMKGSQELELSLMLFLAYCPYIRLVTESTTQLLFLAPKKSESEAVKFIAPSRHGIILSAG